MGTNLCDNLNLAFRQFMENEQSQWVWILNDDHVFHADVLYKLLNRDVDVVTPLIFRRLPPFTAVASFDEVDGIPLNYAQTVLPPDGMVPILGSGTAGMLLTRKAVEAVEDPWFYNDRSMGEDYLFCTRLREAGIDLHLDLDNQMGHIGVCEIWPGKNADGDWAIDVGWQSSFFCQIPKFKMDKQGNNTATQGGEPAVVPDDEELVFEPMLKR